MSSIDNNRELLCGVLRLYLKDIHKKYLDDKKKYSESNFDDTLEIMRRNSNYLKRTQKVLEYLRKGHKYDFSINKDNDRFLPTTIEICVNGRNTWKKIDNYRFELEITDENFKIYNRKLRIDNIINYER